VHQRGAFHIGGQNRFSISDTSDDGKPLERCNRSWHARQADVAASSEQLSREMILKSVVLPAPFCPNEGHFVAFGDDPQLASSNKGPASTE